MIPLDLHGLKTYDLAGRPSKVFVEDLGRPLSAGATVADWIDALRGAACETGLGAALGSYLADAPCRHPEASVLLAAYRQEIPCTVHVALGTDIVHMHPHVSGAATGEASLTDFRRLCAVVTTMA